MSRDSRGYGIQKIRARLAEKGVKSSFVEKHLFADDDIWKALAWKERQKRFGAFPIEQSDKAKQMRFLQQRGFTGQQISFAFQMDPPFRFEDCQKPEETAQESVSLKDIDLQTGRAFAN